ncbi:MAG: cysteine desulfurase [Calditrichaeota bacterium]|nr:MAG: cysteine desulfurase [Calditrichota bacterium]
MKETLDAPSVKAWDVQKIREDFPSLHQQVHGRPLVYLDNAATTQKPRRVIDALRHYYEHDNANVHRGLHALAERATAGFEAAREKVAALIHAPSSHELIFTRGTSESLNLLAYAYGSSFLTSGDEVILTEMEHHSNIVPWFLMRDMLGIRVRFWEMEEGGVLDLNRLNDLITPRTRLISMTHMSNVLGTRNPVEQVCALARDKNIRVIVDGAQSVPSMPVDVGALGCDFLAFSAHKMGGPTGMGALWGREEILKEMRPFMGGGEMIAHVSKEGATWAGLPHKFEAGTPHIAGAIGWGAAVDYIETIGMEAIHAYEQALTAYLLQQMSALEDVTLFGPTENRGPAVSFKLRGVHPFDLTQFLDQLGVAIRVGHHCAEPLMHRLGESATARASLYYYNTREEVDIFVDALRRARDFF